LITNDENKLSLIPLPSVLLEAIRLKSNGWRALNLLPPNISPSQVDPAALVHRHLGPTTYPFVFLYFVQSFVLSLQRLAALPRTPRRPILVYAWHWPGHPSTLPCLLLFSGGGSSTGPPSTRTSQPSYSPPPASSLALVRFGPRSRRRPLPWCSRHGAAVCRSQHGQETRGIGR
jgi:hypothetical protein